MRRPPRERVGIATNAELGGKSKTKAVEINEVVERGEYYTAKTKYRKTLHLGSYNDHQTDLLYIQVGEGSSSQLEFEPLLDEDRVSINLDITPYSSYDLLNEGLAKVLKLFSYWSQG